MAVAVHCDDDDCVSTAMVDVMWQRWSCLKSSGSGFVIVTAMLVIVLRY